MDSVLKCFYPSLSVAFVVYTCPTFQWERSLVIARSGPNLIPGGVLRISSDEDDWMGAKIKTQKIPRGSDKTLQKPLAQKLILKKSHAEFLSLKNFQ